MKEAVSTLSNGGCDLAKIYDLPVANDGCFLGKDQADISNYLNSTIRRRRLVDIIDIVTYLIDHMHLISIMIRDCL